MWFEDYTEKEYRSVKYIMFKTTPIEVEDKIKAFLDKHKSKVDMENISIITEGSKAVIIDHWVNMKKFVTETDILFKDNFFISFMKREGHKNKMFRVRYII